MKTKLITDDQSFTGAKTRFGNEIATYDDGYGALYILRNSTGIQGIVRARSWEDAWSICEDEIFPEADETVEELKAEYGFTEKNVKIIRTRKGVVRPDTASDYPFDKTGCTFVRWDHVKTPTDDFGDNGLFQEAFGYRNNGPKTGDKHGHGIYAKDINGERLDRLTSELVAELEIQLEITPTSNGSK